MITSFLVGVLGLAGLELILSSDRATTAIGSTATGVSGFVERLISPELGLIPNLHDTSAPMASAHGPVTPTSGATPPAGPPPKLPTRPVAKSGGPPPGSNRPPVIAPPTSGSSPSPTPTPQPSPTPAAYPRGA